MTKQILSSVSDFVVENFPETVILPTLGNNDVKFHYQFPTTPELAEDYYGYVFDNFIEKPFGNQNLDKEGIRETFMHGGYFRTEVKGVTFLNLNSLMWAVSRYTLPSEPANEQMDWLEEQFKTIPL